MTAKQDLNKITKCDIVEITTITELVIIVITSIILLSLSGCTSFEKTITKETHTVKVIDQGRPIKSAIKIVQKEIEGVLIDENGLSDGVISLIPDAQGDILLGPKRYEELMAWERALGRFLSEHPEFIEEINKLIK